MYRFCCVCLVLALGSHAWADDVKSPFIFVSEKNIAADNVFETSTLSSESEASMIEQAHAERRKLRERLLDMLGVSRFVPHGSFTTFGLKSRWTLAVPDEETVALRVSVRW